MSYSKENLRYAEEVLSDRRTKAESLQRERRSQAELKCPDIAKCEAELSRLGLSIIEALGKGENAKKLVLEIGSEIQRVQKIIKQKLVENGLPENFLETPYFCEKCNDTGYVGGYSCSCRKELLNSLNVADLEKVSPASACRFDNFSLDYYSDEADAKIGISPRAKMSEISEYCKCYADDFDTCSGSLYMRGATGLGKTHLSLAIANVVARKGFSVVYGSAQNLLSDIEREKFGSGSRNAENRALNCDLLIIDDLGSEFSTTFTVSVLYNIINSRINLSKPVIISTNLSETELEAKYTQRITSRIIGEYTSLFFMGRDIRQIKNN